MLTKPQKSRVQLSIPSVVYIMLPSFATGPGCFVDQLCAGGLSAACGFGYVFNAEHEVRCEACTSVFLVLEKLFQYFCICTHGWLILGVRAEPDSQEQHYHETSV